MKNIEEFCPKGKKDWRKWLEINHQKKESVWLVFYKKKSPKFNLSWSDSVDEALCFGWIDSVKKTIDNERYKQYFSKRKEKSNWSKVNKDKIKILIDQDLMREEGYKSIQIAKENGSWTLLDSVESLEIPEALKQELMKNDGAFEFFENLSKSDKKNLLYWIVSAKRKETKEKRIFEIVESSKEKIKPKQFR